MLTIIDHAIERYIERIAPGTSYATARARLEVHAATAARLRQRTPTGEYVYLAEGLCRLIVRKSQRGEVGGVVITVLPLDSEEELVEESEPDAAAVTGFDLPATMQVLSTDTAILAKLDRQQLLAVKTELAQVKRSAEKNLIFALDRIAELVNIEIKKREDPVRDLRRALGKMLYKYGWVGNEAERAAYEQVKGSPED